MKPFEYAVVTDQGVVRDGFRTALRAYKWALHEAGAQPGDFEVERYER